MKPGFRFSPYRQSLLFCLYKDPRFMYRQFSGKCLYMLSTDLSPTLQTLFAELVQQVILSNCS